MNVAKKTPPSEVITCLGIQIDIPNSRVSIEHIIIKWTKTLQDCKAHHIVQLPSIDNIYLCPVRAVRALLPSRLLPPSAPLFAVSYYLHNQIIDTHFRDALKQVLKYLAIPITGHGFHTFR